MEAPHAQRHAALFFPVDPSWASGAGALTPVGEVPELFDQLACRGHVAHRGGDLVGDWWDRLALEANDPLRPSAR